MKKFVVAALGALASISALGLPAHAASYNADSEQYAMEVQALHDLAGASFVVGACDKDQLDFSYFTQVFNEFKILDPAALQDRYSVETSIFFEKVDEIATEMWEFQGGPEAFCDAKRARYAFQLILK